MDARGLTTRAREPVRLDSKGGLAQYPGRGTGFKQAHLVSRAFQQEGYLVWPAVDSTERRRLAPLSGVGPPVLTLISLSEPTGSTIRE